MPKILIAEDDRNNIEILTDLLTDEGYSLAIATSREEVIKLALAQQPDLILMDVQMPDSSASDVLNREAGLEATRAIKENPAIRNIPVIALTAHNMLHQKERILGAGCDDLQAKPYDFAALLDTIETHLRKPSK
ncbi:MAG: CheY chemotaxis protein or a CheY-like REC (receiver) domain [Verrucomicrobia bacterium]|jgi:CheY-like chemotaxis protein|nr:MAG: CheY chemotaxis protein or a CheY-like REC (receiver) domain [Verrucomicrobiota bacterium]